MANLTEQSSYDAGIYQLETSDSALGGPGAVMNRQAQSLSNRTKWLKAQVDSILLAIENGVQPLDDTLTGLAALLVASANKMIYSTGSNTFSLADLTPFARTLLDDSDAATARGTLGIDAVINAAIAALVNSSPAALDTLNELAAALGNDANFATTMTTALAGKLAKTDLTAVLGVNGFVSIPVVVGETKYNGILQWGEGVATSAGAANTFPITFPHACLKVIAFDDDPQVIYPIVAKREDYSTTGFKAYYGGGSSEQIGHFSIGY
jgi:hypothetical protein